MKLFARVRFRRRLLLSYVLLAAFTLTLVSSMMFLSVYTIVSRNIAFSASQSISQVSDYVDYLMENHLQYALSFSYNARVWEIVSKKPTNYPLSEQFNDKLTLESLLINFESDRRAKAQFTCSLYLNDKFSYTSTWGTIGKFSRLQDTHAYQKMRLYGINTYSAYEPDVYPGDSIVTIHLICDQNDFQSRQSAFTLSFPADVLRTIFKNALPSQNSACLLMDQFGDVVLSTGLSELENVPDIAFTDVYAAARMGKEPILVDNAQMWAHKISSCNWYIAYIVPNEDIASACKPHLWALGISILAVGALIMLMSASLSKTFAKRIEQLSRKISSELSVMPTPIQYEKQGDDIDRLFEQYNAMVNHINNLISDNQEKTRTLSMAELNLLHMQINPHFLFNSLDMLHWMLAEKKFDLVEQTIDKLSDFYRIGLSKGRMLITLIDELSHMRSYVDVQNIRFDKAIQLEINIPDEYMNTLLPRITLQPLVENAIIHGLQNLSDRNPQLSVFAVRDGGDLVISVLDNGVGIPSDKLPTLLTESRQDPRHYGLYNTNKRLQMHFSKRYGLTIYSIPNRMTQVDIRVPLEGAADYVQSTRG